MDYKEVGEVLNKIANYNKKNQEKDIINDLYDLGKTPKDLSQMEKMIIGCLCLVFIKKFVELRENSVLSSFSNFLTDFKNAMNGEEKAVHYDDYTEPYIGTILNRIDITKKSNFSEKMKKMCSNLLYWAKLTATKMDAEDWDNTRKGNSFRNVWDNKKGGSLFDKTCKLLIDNGLPNTKSELYKATKKFEEAK